MNIEITDLDMILNYLETTSLEPHDDYTSEITYKDQKILYRYIKELQQENKKLNGSMQTYNILLKANTEENKRLKDNWNKLKEYIEKDYGFYDKLIAPEYGCAMGALSRIKDKMQELEQGSESDE